MRNHDALTSAALLILAALTLIPGCGKKDHITDPVVSFADVPLSKSIVPGQLDEASGIADSKANSGYLWVEQDGGNPNDITLLSYAGTVFKKINIKVRLQP